MHDAMYAVGGMTCDNCARHVSAALSGLPGVLQVEVDLVAERARVRSDRPLSRDDVQAALDEAGYDLR